MTQTLPLSIVLGPANTGKLIGYTVLHLDRTVFAAFALVTESDVPGTYYAAGGYSAPDAGGYVVVSESDGGDPATLTPLAEAGIESSSVNVTYQAGEPVAAADANGNIPVVLYGTQPAVEFGQVKITTNVASQGALHIRNNNALGRGIDVYSYLAAKLEGSDRGVQLQGGSNQALFLLSDTAAATVYIEGPTTGGKAIAISSPSDGSSPSNASGVYIETQGGHPGILFAFSDPADALSVINSNQGNWTLDELLTDVLEDTGTTLPGLISAGGSGTGLYSETITVKDGDDLPVDGVLVQVATDSAFSNIVRSGYTDNLGQVTLNFDAVGTYYGRAEISDFDVATFTVTIS